MKLYATVFDTPVAETVLTVDERGAVRELHFVGTRTRDELLRRPGLALDEARCRAAREQVEQYFRGERQSFDLALDGQGTPFQRRVWRALLDVPFGRTESYGELAQRIGNPAAARAVGRANGTNPIALIVPCHRVIGADGSLTGYGGGLPIKRALLDFERGQASFAEAATRPRRTPRVLAAP